MASLKRINVSRGITAANIMAKEPPNYFYWVTLTMMPPFCTLGAYEAMVREKVEEIFSNFPTATVVEERTKHNIQHFHAIIRHDKKLPSVKRKIAALTRAHTRAEDPSKAIFGFFKIVYLMNYYACVDYMMKSSPVVIYDTLCHFEIVDSTVESGAPRHTKTS